MIDIKISGKEPGELDIANMVREDAPATRAILRDTGNLTIDFLRTHTSELRPPAQRGGSSRRAHPGHWADVTGNMARAYKITIEGDRLWLENTMPYARFLEERDGFFVLSGVLEDGGVVDRNLRQAVEAQGDGWEYSGR